MGTITKIIWQNRIRYVMPCTNSSGTYTLQNCYYAWSQITKMDHTVCWMSLIFWFIFTQERLQRLMIYSTLLPIDGICSIVLRKSIQRFQKQQKMIRRKDGICDRRTYEILKSLTMTSWEYELIRCWSFIDLIFVFSHFLVPAQQAFYARTVTAFF